jgi:hypothetical protein
MVRVVSVASLGPSASNMVDDWADGVDYSGCRDSQNEEQALADWTERLKKIRKTKPERRVIGKRLA